MGFLELLRNLLEECSNLGYKASAINNGNEMSKEEVLDFEKSISRLNNVVNGLRGKINDSILDSLDRDITYLNLVIDSTTTGEEMGLTKEEVEFRSAVNCIDRIIETVNELIS